MKKLIAYTTAAISLSLLLSSCGLAQGLGQTAGRTLQSAARTIF